MSCGKSHMVDQRPVFDNQIKKKKGKFSANQVVGKAGIIRPDKRHKARYL